MGRGTHPFSTKTIQALKDTFCGTQLIQEGDTIYLKMTPTERQLICNHTKEIQLAMTSSFVLRTSTLHESEDEHSTQGLHGVHLILNNNCSESCNVTIEQSYFSCSYLTFDNLDILIKDSVLKNSFLTSQSKSALPSNGSSIKIHRTKFYSDKLIMDRKGLNATSPCQQLNYICLQGDWDSIQLSMSALEGYKNGKISGVEVQHASIQMLDFLNFQVSSLLSALVIRPSAAIDIVSITGSKFVDNIDGIDVGHRVMYMVVSRSEMNNTGPWSRVDGNSEISVQCSSALRSSAQGLLVQDSLFAHNHASGMNCDGAALFVSNNLITIPQGPPNISMTDKRNFPAHNIEIVRSVFYKNVVEECSASDSKNGGGGAMAVYGLKLNVKVEGSGFVKNKACKGAGIYFGMSDHQEEGYTELQSLGQESLSEIVIGTCTFRENTAEYGAGLMIEFRGFTLGMGHVLKTLVHNSSFNSNIAEYSGGAALLSFSEISVDPYAQIIIVTRGSDFSDNVCNPEKAHELPSNIKGGGALSVNFISSALMSNASVQIELDNCHFFSNNAGGEGGGLSVFLDTTEFQPISVFQFWLFDVLFDNNTAEYGAGLSLSTREILISSLHVKVQDTDFISNHVDRYGAGVYAYVRSYHSYYSTTSFMKIEVASCNFTSNRGAVGAGTYIHVKDYLLDYGSSLILHTSNSTFHGNSAKYNAAAMYTKLENCPLHSASSLTLQASRLTMLSNVAGSFGGGIYTDVTKCPFHDNSSFILHISDSAFTSNAARRLGGAMYTDFRSCNLNSNSTLTIQVSDSSFLSNAANSGVGVLTSVMSSAFHSSSSLRIRMSNCSFTSQIAWDAAGIYTWLEKCSLYSNSIITLETLNSTFTGTEAKQHGGGVRILLEECSLDSGTSLVSQISHSTFQSNVAGKSGAGISAQAEDCTLHSNAVLKLEVAHSTFISNEARLIGAGVCLSVKESSHSYVQNNPSTATEHSSTESMYGFHCHIINCTFVDNFSERGGSAAMVYFLGVQGFQSSKIIGSSFFNNTSKGKGAGLSVTHGTYMYGSYKCISGEFSVLVKACMFRHNSAAKEGGSLYFKLYPTTEVLVGDSVFEGNRALPGSGLYREHTYTPLCDPPSCGSNTKSFISTHIKKCLFTENIDTAVLVKGIEKAESLKVSSTEFRNNLCVDSLFAEDIFTDRDLDLAHTIIRKDKNHARRISINSASDTRLKNVTLHIGGMHLQMQIRVAMFSHVITEKAYGDHDPTINYNCPAFYKPVVSTAGLTDSGAAMVRATCDACFEGYYIGQSELAMSNRNEGNYHCHEREILNDYAQVIDETRFCYTNVTGMCIECPQGANCSAGVLSLPNYWGHMTAAGRLEFHRCPVGYCCNQAPCQGIDQCAAHRVGPLCGQCQRGFTESLITQECIPNETCKDWWIFPLFCLWTLVVALALVFSQDIPRIRKKIQTSFKRSISRGRNGDKACERGFGDIKMKVNNDKGVNVSEYTHSRFESTEELAGMQNVEIQTLTWTPKVPILWGLLTIQREENVRAPGSHKYLQIMLYYLQDAALMQVDLALATTVITPVQKLRQLLLNISQLAVDIIDVGLNLCPIPGWTPVTKLVTKNLTGFFVICIIFVMYGMVNVAGACCSAKRKSLRATWYPRLTAATIFAILLFYQKIANVAFSLLYCIKSGSADVLFLDGNVICYQPWQILVFIFAFNWVVGIIPVLMFLPGLLELRLISVSHFFLACLMPIPMLVYWLVRFYREKLKVLTPTDITMPWHEEALQILQKTFVKTLDKKGLPFCWIGFMKVRRLALVLLFTFVSNFVARVSLMCLVILLFLLFHLETKPYQDDLANNVYTASLIATLAIGFINIMKAACVEFYLDLDKVEHFLITLDMITDGILVYCPFGFIALTVAVIFTGKIKRFIQKGFRTKQS